MPDQSQGVFTSLAVHDGRPVLLSRHIARLQTSCRALYQLNLPTTLAAEAEALAKTVEDDERLRIDVRPADGELRVSLLRGPRPRNTATLEADIITAPNWDYGNKWSDRSDLAETPALYVDGDENVLEFSIANVFMVFGHRIVTPPLDGRILPGITRGWVVENTAVKEIPMSIGELMEADEVFATNAVRGVISVVRCGDKTWRPNGPVATQLSSLYDKL